MKIFENYNTAKQKYGEELANSVLSNGIPNTIMGSLQRPLDLSTPCRGLLLSIFHSS